MDDQEIRTAQKESLERGFKDFMAQPLTRMAISMIPGTGADTLQSLLKAAFESGHNAGSAGIAVMIAKSILEEKRKKGF